MRWNTSSHCPARVWRKRRMVGYQGQSSRSKSQRQSGIFGNATQIGTAKAPARWATAESEVITKSRLFIIAAVSMKGPEASSKDKSEVRSPKSEVVRHSS